jgi:hypothetical protein
MLSLLNAPILTTFGSFTFEQVNIEQAKQLVTYGFQSFIGHQSTCDILSKLLCVTIPHYRGFYMQQPGEQALVFRLKSRIGEGQVLNTIEEIEAVGYEFGLLNRLS